MSKESLKNNLPNSDNYIITTTGSFEDDIINSDFMISYSSTTIEEALHFGKPVGLLGVSNRYRHISESTSTGVSRKAVYHLNHEHLYDSLLKIKSDHYNNPLKVEEINNYVWGDNDKDIWISIFSDGDCIFVGKPEMLLKKYTN